MSGRRVQTKKEEYLTCASKLRRNLSQCLRVKRCWYGTRDAGQAFEFAVRDDFEVNSFSQGAYSPCVYRQQDTLVVVLFFLLEQTTVFSVSFQSFGNSMILPAALPERFLNFGVQVSFVLRTLTWSVSLTCTLVGGRRFSAHRCCRGWASFSAHFWTAGTYFCVYDVETATIGTIGRGLECVDNFQNCRSNLLCFLMPQNFVVDFVEILTEVEIHRLLFDACTLDTCSVTDDLLRRSLDSS